MSERERFIGVWELVDYRIELADGARGAGARFRLEFPAIPPDSSG